MNSLLAEFIGGIKITQKGWNYYKFYQEFVGSNDENIMVKSNIFRSDKLRFDESWDWLIFVADAVKSIDKTKLNSGEVNRVINTLDITLKLLDLKGCYYTLVEFIRLYNKANNITNGEC